MLCQGLLALNFLSLSYLPTPPLWHKVNFLSGVLVLCRMQSVSSRIWTRITVSISYDDNHYTTGTSQNFLSLSLEISVQLFFLQFLFPRYCCSVCPFIVIVVTGRCNQFFLDLFNVVFEFSNLRPRYHQYCFSWHILCLSMPYLGCKRPCASSSTFLPSDLSSSAVYFKNSPEYLARETPQVFWRFLLQWLFCATSFWMFFFSISLIAIFIGDEWTHKTQFLNYYNYYYYYSLGVFPTNVSWWSFNGALVTTSLPNSSQ